MTPKRTNRHGRGYDDLEREIEGWIFRGRNEVNRERLRDSYSKGGAQLVDVWDKVRTQRVGWLKKLLQMPEDTYPKALAEALIGQWDGGYKGLEVLKMKGQVRLRGSSFYKVAIKAWWDLPVDYEQGSGSPGGGHVFYNPRIVDNEGVPLDATHYRGMTARGIFRVGDLTPRQPNRRLLEELRYVRSRIPGELPDTEPCFVVPAPAGRRMLSGISFKEIYLVFRSQVVTSRHYESKWEEVLGTNLEGEWEGIWDGLHNSRTSLKVRSSVWRQIGLNFWTSYMDHAYIARGDGCCRMCGVFARERWHIVVECQVVRNLWDRLSATLGQIKEGSVSRREMGLGLQGDGVRVRLRNRLGFTLRAVVLSLRAGDYGSARTAEGVIWSVFRVRLKRELVEDYWVAKMGGELDGFRERVFPGGILGHLGPEGDVEWAGLLGDVGVGYWDLFG